MSLNTINADMLRRMFLAGAKRLDSKKDYINELNVFPVPDGDTGTNMTMTIMSAVSELDSLEELTMLTISKAISQGALRGARGNSGVILSQLFRGFTRALKTVDEIGPETAAEAFKRASDTAYKAVMKPKEGTILTVARGMSEKAQDVFDGESVDMEEAFRQIIEYGNYMLSLTPEMLPVLKQAGVVDSGGKGLMTILEGAYDCLTGKEEEEEQETGENTEPEIRFTYFVDYLITPSDSFGKFEQETLVTELSSVGENITVVPEGDAVRVHILTDNPGLAVQSGIACGSLTDIKIGNIRAGEAECEIKQDSDAASSDKTEETQTQPPKATGFVAVSVGEGMKEIFEGLGVDIVVEGGQTMNPSTADILDAVEKVNAKTVFVMPNNKNIILASNQAAQLCKDRKVIVIPSKTVPQGITAVINYNEGISDEENAENMTEEMSSVKSAQITFAIRDTSIDDKEVHKGDIMGLSDDGLAAVGSDVGQTVIDTVTALADDETEIITLYYGSDVEESDARNLSQKLQEKYPDAEVEVYNGGQPIYYYVLSVE